MTFTDIQTYVAGRLNLTSTEALTRLGVEINRAYRRVMTSVGLAQVFRRAQSEFSIVTGTQLQTVPVEKVHSVKVSDIVSGQQNPFMEELTYDEMLVTVPLSGNIPTKYAVKRWNAGSVTLVFNCLFDTAQTLTIDGEEITSDLAGSQEPAFPESWHEVIIYSVLSPELRKKEKLNLAREEKLEYERMMGELRLWVAARGMLDSQQGRRNTDSTFQADLGTMGAGSSSGGGSGGGGGTTSSLLWYINAMDPAYGCAGDGVHDDTAAFQAALTAAQGKTLFLPYGKTFRLTANVNVPVGFSTATRILGQSWTAGGILLDGAAVTTGLTFSGSSYDQAEGVENCQVKCQNGAARCITFNNVNHPYVHRCRLRNAAGAAVYYNLALMGRLSYTIMTGNGSTTEATVEVDNSTTWVWDQSRISGVGSSASSTQGGVRIDRTNTFDFRGGNIESSQGVPIRIGSKTEAAIPTTYGTIENIDLENPGNTALSYIEMGYGWTGGASIGVYGISVRDVIATPSGTTDIRYGVKLKNTNSVHIHGFAHTLVGGSQTAAFWLEGNTNAGLILGPNKLAFGYPYPWLMVNGAAQWAATPYKEFYQDEAQAVNLGPIGLTGATPDIRLSTTQGGVYQRIALTQGGATNVTKFQFGGGSNMSGVTLHVTVGDNNTTFKHAAVGGASGEIHMARLADKAAVTGEVYVFVNHQGLWYEVSAASLAQDLNAMPINGAWVDYTATSTIVGWSAFGANKVIQYRMLSADTALVMFVLQGTSNSVNTSFTLPFSITNVAPWAAIQVQDNGIASATPGVVVFNGVTVTCYRDWTATAAGWTNAGQKSVVGQFIVRIS